jgi:L-alanine-DL-glutamate epimerase-like enolase superfamily enzyme
MKITGVTTRVAKMQLHDRFGGQSAPPATFPGSDYYFESQWSEVYSRNVQSLLVHIETDTGLHGWGESQAPIVPEVAQTIIDRLLGPMLIGRDPLETDRLFELMYKSMSVRGHTTGFMLDAIAGIDIALWDIKGKAAGQPVSRLLQGTGEAIRTRLSLYVSGLRAASIEGKAEFAAECFSSGYAAVKVFLGHGVEEDLTIARALRERVGPEKRLLADTLWSYDLADALRLGKAFEDLGFEWIEAPVDVEDVDGHATLARSLEMAVAGGEALRSQHQFAHWIGKQAMDIVQPDVGRCGITGAQRIAALARENGLPVAFHVGVCLGVVMAATWQVAAATPNFRIQEHQPPPFELSNRFLKEPLSVDRGEAVVPDRPGIGVDIDVEAFDRLVLG